MARTRTNAARRAESIERARGRRTSTAAARAARIDWFIDEVESQINMSVEARVKLATDYLRNKVVKNISRPVTKEVSKRGRVRVTQRSLPGEFPRADTTLLMKTLFGAAESVGENTWEGIVGTPLEYGLILEVNERLDRSFLRRTFREEYDTLMRILTAPLDGYTAEVVT